MNEQNNDPYGIITSAERLVAELWEAKRNEENQENQASQDAPPCPEAVEDEANRVEAFAKALAMESFEGFKAFTVVDIDRCSHDGLDIAVYEVRGIVEFDCGKCSDIHESPTQCSAIRIGQGDLLPLKSETILDRGKEIMEKRRERHGGPQIVRLSMEDLIDGIADRLQAKIADGNGNGGEDDPLPPAATTVGGDDDDDLPPSAIVETYNLSRIKDNIEICAEQTAPMDRLGTDDDTETRLPVIDIDEYRIVRRCNAYEQPGLLRRAWNRLWRR